MARFSSLASLLSCSFLLLCYLSLLVEVAAITSFSKSNSQGTVFLEALGLLPTSAEEGRNLLATAKATFGVMVVVNGKAPSENDLVQSGFFQTSYKSETAVTALSEEEILNNMGGMDRVQRLLEKLRSFAFVTSKTSSFEEVETFWRVNSNKVEEVLGTNNHCGKHVIVKSEEKDGLFLPTQRLEDELALLTTMVEKLGTTASRPATLYATVDGLQKGSLSRLSDGLEAIYKLLSKSTARPIMIVVFTGQSQAVSGMLTESQVAESRRQLQPSKKSQPFQGSDYVIMFWTIVGLIILVIFVFLCIPWAPVLDPALRSTLKADSKRD